MLPREFSFKIICNLLRTPSNVNYVMNAKNCLASIFAFPTPPSLAPYHLETDHKRRTKVQVESTATAPPRERIVVKLL